MTDTSDITPIRRRRRSSARRDRAQSRRRWLRPLYFAIAALWGYVTGIAIVIFLLRPAEQELRLGTLEGALLILGALAAGVGGVVSALAYRQVRHRLS